MSFGSAGDGPSLQLFVNFEEAATNRKLPFHPTNKNLSSFSVMAPTDVIVGDSFGSPGTAFSGNISGVAIFGRRMLLNEALHLKELLSGEYFSSGAAFSCLSLCDCG